MKKHVLPWSVVAGLVDAGLERRPAEAEAHVLRGIADDGASSGAMVAQHPKTGLDQRLADPLSLSGRRCSVCRLKG